jgi:hypothetical protein
LHDDYREKKAPYSDVTVGHILLKLSHHLGGAKLFSSIQDCIYNIFCFFLCFYKSRRYQPLRGKDVKNTVNSNLKLLIYATMSHFALTLGCSSDFNVKYTVIKKPSTSEAPKTSATETPVISDNDPDKIESADLVPKVSFYRSELQTRSQCYFIVENWPKDQPSLWVTINGQSIELKPVESSLTSVTLTSERQVVAEPADYLAFRALLTYGDSVNSGVVSIANDNEVYSSVFTITTTVRDFTYFGITTLDSSLKTNKQGYGIQAEIAPASGTVYAPQGYALTAGFGSILYN